MIFGFGTLGQLVGNELEEKNQPFVVISDNLKQVLLGRKRGYKAYFGHLEKLPVLQSLKAEFTSSIILTLSNTTKRRIICEAVLKYNPQAHIVVKIDSIAEKRELKDLNIKSFVHAQKEISTMLVDESLKCSLD